MIFLGAWYQQLPTLPKGSRLNLPFRHSMHPVWLFLPGREFPTRRRKEVTSTPSLPTKTDIDG